LGQGLVKGTGNLESNLGAFGIGLGFGNLYLGFWEMRIGVGIDDVLGMCEFRE